MANDIKDVAALAEGIPLVRGGKALKGGLQAIAMEEAAAAGSNLTMATVRSVLAPRIGKRGYTEVGYQFQKHFGRGGNWGEFIPSGAKLNPATFNDAGYKTFQNIWRSPGSFQQVGSFFEKGYLMEEAFDCNKTDNLKAFWINKSKQ